MSLLDGVATESIRSEPLQKIIAWGISQIVLSVAPDAKVDVETAALLMGVSAQEVRRCTQRYKKRPPRLPSQRGRRRRVIIPLAALVAYMNGDRRKEGGAS